MLFVRLRCLPASVFGPPLLPLRRLAWRCRCDAIWVLVQKNGAGAAVALAPDMIFAFGGAAGEWVWR